MERLRPACPRPDPADKKYLAQASYFCKTIRGNFHGLERRLWDEGRLVTVLYGQNMRQGLNRDLGFTADDRSENLRRSAEVAKLLNDAGVITIAAFVAPHEDVREKAKQLIGGDRVLEVYCTAPMEGLRARDHSGAYHLADEGRIAQMPGVTAAFEEPKTPDLVLETEPS